MSCGGDTLGGGLIRICKLCSPNVALFLAINLGVSFVLAFSFLFLVSFFSLLALIR